MVLEPAVERAPAQAQRPGGVAHVAAVRARAPSGSGRARLPRAAGPPAGRAGAAARGARGPRRAPGLPAAISTARSSVWSSSRTLPGQAWRLERLQRLGLEAGDAASGSARRSAARKCAAERPDVLAALAQRRQADLDRVEAEQQVLAEPAGRHLGARGRRWSRRGCARRLAARARSRPARTRRSRARAAAWPAAAARALPISSRNSVPPSASSKRPMRSVLRVGEGALHVAEHLALEHALGEPAHVHRDQRPRGPGRGGVDPLRHDLLAGAVLAGDQHVGVGRRRRARSAAGPAASPPTRR